MFWNYASSSRNAANSSFKHPFWRWFNRSKPRQQHRWPWRFRFQSFSTPPPSWRVARAELLDSADGFWARLRLRIRLFLTGTLRPWGADDVVAMFSWIFVGHTVFLFVGTTTAAGLVIGVANSLQFQAYLAQNLSDYVTASTGFKVTFESAIVPRWRSGVIRLENVQIQCNDHTWLELQNAERAKQGLAPLDMEDLDVNWTYWDLSIRHVDVALSLWRWLDGKGAISECTLKGVRGVVDRRHVTWPDDWVPVRRKLRAGDFEIDRFVIEDLLLTVRNPNFRPYSVSIFNAEMPRLRKQWLLYDFMRADSMNGMFDDCLFSVHRMQRMDLVVDEGGLGGWGKVSHLKLKGLPISHVNHGLEGPLGWITKGFVDIDLQLLFPTEENDNLLDILKDEIEDVAAKIVEVVGEHPEAGGRRGGVVRYYKARYGKEEIETADTQSGLHRADRGDATATDTPLYSDSHDVPPIPTENVGAVLIWNVRLNDIKASVPLVSPHLSYLNSALVRPIVAYLNAVKTSIAFRFKAKMDIENFDGAWTIYQSHLVDVLGEEVGRALSETVMQQKNRRLREMAVWGLGSGVRKVVGWLEGVVNNSTTLVTGVPWYMN
ncbi:Mitochondrial distribution and morphology protein 31, mitochondrial precursor [Gaertneriomyces sp. JEL0708]|nr:Mitochondrial distribution and morphology protein 31, mitochondrial precursor [Gaertneriomyces sp. JEL0708]